MVRSWSWPFTIYREDVSGRRHSLTFRWACLAHVPLRFVFSPSSNSPRPRDFHVMYFTASAGVLVACSIRILVKSREQRSELLFSIPFDCDVMMQQLNLFNGRNKPAKQRLATFPIVNTGIEYDKTGNPDLSDSYTNVPVELIWYSQRNRCGDDHLGEIPAMKASPTYCVAKQQ